MSKIYFFLITLSITLGFQAQQLKDTTKAKTPTATKKWYESVQMRGYMQVRYNGLLQTNEDLECEQCDRSWGGDNDFFIRRMRLIFFGQVSPRVYFYIQPDFASSPSSSAMHFGQLRDAYDTLVSRIEKITGKNNVLSGTVKNAVDVAISKIALTLIVVTLNKPAIWSSL